MKSKILEEIDSFVEESKPLAEEADRFSENHIRWVFKVKAFLAENFGEDSSYYRNFVSFSWVNEGQAIIGGPARPAESHNPQLGIDRVNREAYQKQLKASRGFLLAAKDELERKGAGKEEKIGSFLAELKKNTDLCIDGLLKAEELIELKRDAEKLFEELFANDKDAIIYRKFYKLKNSGDWIWNERPKLGGFVGANKLDILFRLDEILKEMLSSLGTEIKDDDALISKGEHYSAKKTLRGIFAQASKKIEIMDKYLDCSILQLLELQVASGSALEIFLLTTNISKAKFQSLSTDLEAFKKQYPKLKIELKKATDLAHDRFILIDDSQVFQSGHSICQLGEATSRISKMTKQDDIDKILNEFKNAWNAAQTV